MDVLGTLLCNSRLVRDPSVRGRKVVTHEQPRLRRQARQLFVNESHVQTLTDAMEVAMAHPQRCRLRPTWCLLGPRPLPTIAAPRVGLHAPARRGRRGQVLGPSGCGIDDAPVRFAVGIRAVDAPLLMLHGGVDRTVPVELGRRLRDAAPPGVRWVDVPGGSHSRLHSEAPEVYRRALQDLAREMAARPEPGLRRRKPVKAAKAVRRSVGFGSPPSPAFVAASIAPTFPPPAYPGGSPHSP